MSELARTSISISTRLLAQGKARSERMKHKSFSHYLAYLIADDIKTLRKHIIELDEPSGEASNDYPSSVPAKKKGRRS